MQRGRRRRSPCRQARASAHSVGNIRTAHDQNDRSLPWRLFEKRCRCRGPRRLGHHLLTLVKQPNRSEQLLLRRKRDLVDQLPDRVYIFGYGRLGCQAVGAGLADFYLHRLAFLPGKIVRRRSFGLNANDLDVRMGRLYRGSYAANQRRISHGHINRSHRG